MDARRAKTTQKMKTDSTATSPQTHAEFLASLRDAHQNSRPISYFRQWPVEYLIEAGLPQDWLEKCGLVKTDGAALGLPNQCSQRAFAEIVTKLYGKPVNQAAVSRAIKDGLNVAVTPSNGRLKTDIALRWWEQNKAGVAGSLIASEQEDKAARQRIAREREQMELDEIKRRHSDDWMLTSVAIFTVKDVATTVRNSIRVTIEKRLKDEVETVIRQTVSDVALQQTLVEKLRPIYPAIYDGWQADMGLRIDQLIKDGKAQNLKLKSEL